jgi:hypothetical protein
LNQRQSDIASKIEAASAEPSPNLVTSGSFNFQIVKTDILNSKNLSFYFVVYLHVADNNHHKNKKIVYKSRATVKDNVQWADETVGLHLGQRYEVQVMRTGQAVSID